MYRPASPRVNPFAWRLAGVGGGWLGVAGFHEKASLCNRRGRLGGRGLRCATSVPPCFHSHSDARVLCARGARWGPGVPCAAISNSDFTSQQTVAVARTRRWKSFPLPSSRQFLLQRSVFRIPSAARLLRSCCGFGLASVTQWLVGLAGYPQSMQQHGELSRYRYHRSLLP
jgi:hypothetical protein